MSEESDLVEQDAQGTNLQQIRGLSANRPKEYADSLCYVLEGFGSKFVRKLRVQAREYAVKFTREHFVQEFQKIITLNYLANTQ